MDLYTDNLALELGDNSKIGIGVDEVGYGLLETRDTVTIHGSYVEEIYLESKEPPIIIKTGSTGSTENPPTIPGDITNLSRVKAEPANLLGSANMLSSDLTNSFDDSNIIIGDIGFNFPFYNSSFSGDLIYVNSNSYITFGYGSLAYSNLSRTNPGAGLFINPGARSYQAVYGIKNSNSFRIIYEGSQLSNSNLTYNVVWEVTLFNSGTIQLVISDFNIGQGVAYTLSYLTQRNGTEFVDFVPATNSFYVFARKSSTLYEVVSGYYV